jgi:hypothetical protein
MMKKTTVLALLFALTGITKTSIADPIAFNEYHLFYQNLTNTSDLGFDWIFDTENPDSLGLKFIYIYPNSPFAEVSKNLINYRFTTIVAIDGKSTAKMTRQQATDLMKGAPGTECELTIRTKSDEHKINYSLNLPLIRATYTSPASTNYQKGIEAFKQAKIDEAIKYFSDYSYPPNQIILYKIYSGRILDEIEFTSQEDKPTYQKLYNLFNIDSIKKYSQNPNYNPTLTALLSLYCNEYKFKTEGLTNAKIILTKKAADEGDVWAQEIMCYKHANHFRDDDLITGDILPDKQQAMYWYKRALAGGSKQGPEMLQAVNAMKKSEDVYGLDLAKNRVFDFKDAKAVTLVAHLPHGLMGIIPEYISPFGVHGFEEGVVYTENTPHLPFTWNTHIIKDKAFALKYYEEALYVLNSEFGKGDLKDVKWFHSPEREGNILKNNAATFTATEKDQKTYAMSMMLYLTEVAGGYQINLQYAEQ